MTPEQFAARRQAGWAELESHLAQARRGALRSVPAADLQRFGVLYRHAASDLAIARRDFAGQPVTEYLNSLCGRAHPLIYRGRPVRPSALPRFYASVLPRAVRAAGPYVAASLALSVAGVLAGWLSVRLRPDLAATLIPDSLFDRMARGEVSGGIGDAPVAASLIIGNNVKVALLCFCGGVLLGIPTALTLLANGWVLGTLASSIHRDGIDYRRYETHCAAHRSRMTARVPTLRDNDIGSCLLGGLCLADRGDVGKPADAGFLQPCDKLARIQPHH